MTEEEYERLSQIAPTVPYAKIAYATTWEEEAEVTAKALGKEAEGAELIENTKALIAEKLAEHPELEGKTAAFCYIDPSNLSMVYIYMPLDPRAAFLEELGMKVPESITSNAGDGDFSVDCMRKILICLMMWTSSYAMVMILCLMMLRDD